MIWYGRYAIITFGQVRLGGSVRNYFSVRTIFHSTGCCKLPRWESSNVVCHAVRSITWWRHQMETFSALLALCAGNSPVPVNSPHKGQWRGALMFSFIYVWINDWVNNCEAGDLRRQRGHYDVNVMNKSRDTQNCVQNGAEYTICVLLITRFYYKALWIILCTLTCQIRCNYNRLDDSHCDDTGHRKMSALGTTGAMTTHENSLMVWS